jgi:hypothetical protein
LRNPGDLRHRPRQRFHLPAPGASGRRPEEPPDQLRRGPTPRPAEDRAVLRDHHPGASVVPARLCARRDAASGGADARRAGRRAGAVPGRGLSRRIPLRDRSRAAGAVGGRRVSAVDAVPQRRLSAARPSRDSRSFGVHSVGTLEKAQPIAAHESPKTPKLYDRTSDEIDLGEIEKIIISYCTGYLIRLAPSWAHWTTHGVGAEVGIECARRWRRTHGCACCHGVVRRVLS